MRVSQPSDRDLRPQFRDQLFHRRATRSFTRRIGFDQMLRLVGRSGRPHARFHKIIRNGQTIKICGRRSFLRFGEQAVADGDVGMDFAGRLIRCEAGAWFRQDPRLLFRNGIGSNCRARFELSSCLHELELSSSRAAIRPMSTTSRLHGAALAFRISNGANGNSREEPGRIRTHRDRWRG